eukprot:TRINITY_DN78407_c0_g1_i1.p1 TRINITY_DN78407_c0_g1~~TRINITY_DN78407_c0_g1_i1.p1  ORF type:complete len:570 (-),score=94.49 TRINITY_DN78407_c0_g1_i1:55-1692(-)
MAALQILIIFVAVWCQAGNARRLKPQKSGGFLSKSTEPKQALLAEMEAALGSEHPEMTHGQIKEFEKELEHTYKALPKNARGAIAAPSVRYALHRLFNQRYGWQIKGLETSGGAWDSDSPLVAMDNHVPPSIRDLFERRLGDYGLNLHELAVLAATMEDMIRKDVIARLQIVYDAYHLPHSGTLELHDVRQVRYAYLASLVSGSSVEKLTREEVLATVNILPRMFPRVVEANELLDNIMKEVAGESTSFGFSTLTSVFSIFGQQFGSMEDKECKVMKDKLIAREEQPGNGRVRLGDFYGYDSLGMEHFTESPEYLRAHGMLDESSPNDPKVIIPNYLAGTSNCISPSGHYEICCFDECESLMDKIEEHVGAPMATAEVIATYVSSLASASRPANRTLPSELLDLLNDVAGHHGGMVPIHGRLFSQWMHQAYPRECAHPHTESKNRFQFTGPHATASDEEKQSHMEVASQAKSQAGEQIAATGLMTAGLWTMSEELVDAQALHKHKATSSRLYDLFACGVAGSVAFLLVKMLLGDKVLRTQKSKLV